MPQTLHVERHFSGSEIVRGIVGGMLDELISLEPYMSTNWRF